MRRLAALGAALALLVSAAPAAAEPLTAMTFNAALRWSGMPGNRFDWIGIFRDRPTLDVYGYLGFSYVDALPQGRMTMTRADLGRLPPGRYVAGLFMDDGYALLARTRFRIARSE